MKQPMIPVVEVINDYEVEQESERPRCFKQPFRLGRDHVQQSINQTDFEGWNHESLNEQTGNVERPIRSISSERRRALAVQTKRERDKQPE